MYRTACLVLLVVVLSLAPAMAGKYETWNAPGVNVGGYETWSWDVAEGADVNRLPGEPHIMRAVERELADRGYSKGTGEDVDFRVTYAIGIGSTDTAGRETRMVDPTGMWVTGLDTVNRYAEGNLILQLIDVETGKKVFEGLARKAIREDKAVKPEKIRSIVARLMETIPARESAD